MESTSRKPVSRKRPEHSNSTLDLFTKCPYRYYLEAIEGWKPRIAAKPLRFGSIIHECLENYWTAISRGTERQKIEFGIEHTINTWLERQARMLVQYAENTDIGRAMDAIVQSQSGGKDDIEGMQDLAHGMMTSYVEKYHVRDSKRYDVLGVEEKITFPLRTPSGVKSLYDYSGKLDLIIIDRSTNILYVVDHKTTIEKHKSSLMADYAFSMQPRGYLWLVRQKYPGYAGYNFIFDVLRKKVPSVPKLLAKPQDGRKLSRAACDTTADIFYSAIAENDPGNEEAYRDILNALRAQGDTFLWREEINVSDADVQMWNDDRWRVARNIALAKRSAKTLGGFTRNYTACRQKVGKCPFCSVCLESDASAVDWGEFEKRDSMGSIDMRLEPDDEPDDSDGDSVPFA